MLHSVLLRSRSSTVAHRLIKPCCQPTLLVAADHIRNFSTNRSLDYYKVLGVDKSATPQEIKKAYFALAKKYHPDQNKGDKSAEKKFQEASEAYEILGDEKKKSAYDQFGHAGVSGDPDGDGAQGFPGGFQNFQGFSNVFDLFGSGGGFQDIFENARAASGQGQDVGTRVKLSLKDVLKVTKKDLSFQAYTKCGKCGGNGCENGNESHKSKCSKCGGKRFIVQSRGGWQMQVPCTTCNGLGFQIKHQCKECAGSGRCSTKKKVTIDIPPGVETGVTMTVRGEGSAGEHKTPPGDLLVEIEVENDPEFERDGANLLTKRRISLIDSILGGKTEVTALDGVLDIKIPAGTTHGEKLRIPSRGLPKLQQRGRGDLFVKFEVELPRDLTERQRQLLTEFQQEEDKKRGVEKSKSLYEKIKDVAGL